MELDRVTYPNGFPPQPSANKGDVLEKIDKREIKMMILGGRQPLHDGNFTYSLHEKIPDAESEILALARIGQRVRWIPVSERLPEIEEPVLVIGECGFGVDHLNGVVNRRPIWHWDSGITHWMPLPQPPSENDRPGEGEQP